MAKLHSTFGGGFFSCVLLSASVMCPLSAWRCICLRVGSVFHSWLLTPKQCDACVSRWMITNRIADWQTNISILNTEQQTKQKSRALTSNSYNVSVSISNTLCSPIQRWLVSSDRLGVCAGGVVWCQSHCTDTVSISDIILFSLIQLNQYLVQAEESQGYCNMSVCLLELL